MHHGILASTAPQAELLAVLEHHLGPMSVGEDIGSPHRPRSTVDSDRWLVAVGEHDGGSFVFDSSMLLPDRPDMIVSMSRILGTVVGVGAETLSGTYWLMVARNGEPQRYVFVCYAAMTRGMAIGTPLPTESEYPVDDPSGAGLLAAMSDLGLDPRPWLDAGPAYSLRYDTGRTPQGGPIEEIRAEHCHQYERDQREQERWFSSIDTSSEGHEVGANM